MGRDSTDVWAVSLGVYMSAQNAFERYQSGNHLPLRIPFELIGNSSFSEEDLMSDLIGFYIALDMERGGEPDPQKLKDEIRRICGVVGLDDYARGDLGTYNTKQALIYYETYYEIGKVDKWFSPKLYKPSCVDDCENEPRKIPEKFLEISPIDPHSEGLWNWYSLYEYSLLGTSWSYWQWMLDDEVLDHPK